MTALLPLVLRYLHVASLLLCCGTGIYLGWIACRELAEPVAVRARQTYRICLLLACVTSLTMIPAQAANMGGTWHGLVAPGTWLQVLQHTNYGQAWFWQLLLLPLLGLAILPNHVAARRHMPHHLLPSHRMVALASGAMLAALAATGHAAAMEGWEGWLHRGNQALHLLAIAGWAGSLPWVLGTLRRLDGPQRAAATRTLIRYSSYGQAAVATALLTGLANLFFILGPWPWNWTTLYMRLMETKFLAVFTMVALALFNRYVLVPRLRAHPEALKPLARNTRLGMMLALGVLLLIGVIGMLPPD